MDNQNVRKRGRGHFYFNSEKNDSTTTNKAGLMTMESTDSRSLNKNVGLLTMGSTDPKNLKNAGLLTMEPTGSQKTKSTTHTSVEEEEAFQKLMEEAEQEEKQEISESMEKLILEEDMEINEEGEEEQMEEGEINESEWAQSSSNWENPNKEESFANKAFENQEWQEVKSKSEKKKEKIEEEAITASRKKRYVVSQVQEKRAIAVIPNPEKLSMWPFAIEIPDELTTDLERPLFPGDSIFVNKFAWIEGRRQVTIDNWYRKDTGILSYQATALMIDVTHFPYWTTKTGIITYLKKKEGKAPLARVTAYGMERSGMLYAKQCRHGLDLSKTRLSEFVNLKLAPIPAGWMIGSNYIVPPGGSYRLGTEIMAKEGSQILACAEPFTERWRWLTKTGLPKVFPIDKDYTLKEMKLAEDIIAAALITAAENEEVGRMETSYFGVVKPLEDEKKRTFTISHIHEQKAHIAKVLNIWTKDTPVTAKTGFERKAFANGYIKEVVKCDRDDGLLQIEVNIILVPNEGLYEHDEDFEAMTHGMLSIIQVAETPGGYRDQADTFGLHAPTQLIKEEKSPRTEILKALFGRPGTDDSVVGGDIPKDLECVKSLNEEQQNTLSNWLHEGRGRLHYQQAPPGTGKTRLAAACIAAALKKDPKIAVLATANSNLPVSKLIDESAQINLGSEMLAFFASTARIRYGDQILLLNEHQLENKIKGKFVEKLEGSEKRDVTDYLAHIKDKPRHTKERKVGEIYLAREFKNAIFGTIYMCLGIPRAHVSTTHLIIDEVTQTSFSMMVHLLCKLPLVRSVLLTGDVRQLGTHLKELPEVIQSGYGLESVTDQMENCERVSVTILERCYRSHPIITECFDYSSYEKHGERVIAAVPAEKRTGLTKLGINLPVNDVPLILLNIRGRIEQDSASYSLSSPEQTEAAITIAKALEHRDPQGVAIICLYTFQCEKIRERLQQENIQVSVNSVDAFQSREHRLIILVTTSTKAPGSAARADASDFLKDSRRATVALSRAQSGLIIIADFEAIREGETWRRFITAAKQHTPFVDERYLEVMEHEEPTRDSNGVLNDLKGRSIEVKVEEVKLIRGGELRTGRGKMICNRCGNPGHLARDCRRR
uniref:CCHC-type domain-containing protein n=2 Tax=Meloidogyne TaxID=189290 RepID=A0A6V7XWD1_MELEN|nr:unnamed protein product [Meloidogyne enterolobii]